MTALPRRHVWCLVAHAYAKREASIVVPVRWIRRGWPGDDPLRDMLASLPSLWMMVGQGRAADGTTICVLARADPIPKGALTKEARHPKSRKPTSPGTSPAPPAR